MLDLIGDILAGFASIPGGEDRKRHRRIHWLWWIAATALVTGIIIYFF